MPKTLFYAGTAFCLFVALCSAAAAAHTLQGGTASFIALGGAVSSRAAWAILVALVAALSIAMIFLRMAALVAARNLFAAVVAVVSVAAALISLTWVVMLQVRMMRSVSPAFADLHLAGVLMLAYFVSLSLLALRPYFRVQASRTLSALVFLPLPLILLIVSQELFVRRSEGIVPAGSPALVVYFAILALLFFAISIHCIRHRYLFLEMTNLRELLDSRVDPTARGTRRTIGGVAYDS